MRGKERNKVVLIIGLLFFVAVTVVAHQAIAATGNYTAWIDHGVGYTAPAGNAYYPSVIYDANGFGAGTPRYAMWYSDGNGPVYLVTSSDGVTWGAPATMTGIAAHHVQVLYDANCFGIIPCNTTTTKYRIWFWDMSASLYSISSMATAESADGIHWTNKAAVTQNPAAKLVQDPDSGVGWNRGTYGPVSMFYQPNAINTGTEPWDYRYVMYYNGTDGGHEETGLAYSTDGLYWNAYTANPVLSASRTGGSDAWDCVSAVYGTVFKDFSGYHYIFSGKGQDDGSGGCASPSNFYAIGYASSTDGKTWVKDANPIFKTSDGVPYRSGRIYTPSVIDDGSGILRMYFSVTDPTGSPKKIGYATLSAPVSPTPLSPPAPVSVPTPPSVSGGSLAESNIYFYGQTYPGSTIKALRKSEITGPYESVPIISTFIAEDGKFQISVLYFFQYNYFFAIQAVDKNGRESQILPLISQFVPLNSSLTLKDILVPPTIEITPSVTAPGQPIKIIGYAAPSSAVEVLIDDGPMGQTISDTSGSYSFTASTAQLSLADHTIKARFVLPNGTKSDFSFEKVFRVSSLAFPKTDLNNDNTVNVSDWSIFLFRWGSNDAALKSSIDFNGDGKVDIFDFGIFLDSMRLK